MFSSRQERFIILFAKNKLFRELTDYGNIILTAPPPPPENHTKLIHCRNPPSPLCMSSYRDGPLGLLHTIDFTIIVVISSRSPGRWPEALGNFRNEKNFKSSTVTRPAATGPKRIFLLITMYRKVGK